MVEDFRQWGDPSNFHLIGISHLQHIKQQSNIVDNWRKNIQINTI